MNPFRSLINWIIGYKKQEAAFWEAFNSNNYKKADEVLNDSWSNIRGAKEGYTCLHYYISQGYTTSKSLLSKFDINYFYIRDKDGRTVFDIETKKGDGFNNWLQNMLYGLIGPSLLNHGLFSWILTPTDLLNNQLEINLEKTTSNLHNNEQNKDIKANMLKYGKDGSSVLMQAINSGNIRLVKLMLEHAKKIMSNDEFQSFISHQDKKGNTSMKLALKTAHISIDMAKLLYNYRPLDASKYKIFLNPEENDKVAAIQNRGTNKIIDVLKDRILLQNHQDKAFIEKLCSKWNIDASDYMGSLFRAFMTVDMLSDENFKIYATSSEHLYLSGLAYGRYHDQQGYTGEYSQDANVIAFSLHPIDDRDEYRKGGNINKTFHTLMHEFSHRLIDKVGIGSKMTLPELSKIRNEIFDLSNSSVKNKNIPKYLKHIYQRVVHRISDISFNLYNSDRKKNEEIIVDTIGMTNAYIEKHPERAADTMKVLSPLYGYINREMVPQIEEKLIQQISNLPPQYKNIIPDWFLNIVKSNCNLRNYEHSLSKINLNKDNFSALIQNHQKTYKTYLSNQIEALDKKNEDIKTLENELTTLKILLERTKKIMIKSKDDKELNMIYEEIIMKIQKIEPSLKDAEIHKNSISERRKKLIDYQGKLDQRSEKINNKIHDLNFNMSPAKLKDTLKNLINTQMKIANPSKDFIESIGVSEINPRRGNSTSIDLDIF